MKISIVIPAHNEQGGIGPTLDNIPIDRLEKAGYEVEKIVVDNLCSDNTVAEARAHGAQIVVEPNKGYGNAYRAGFYYATGDIIATSDADFTYPLDYLPEMLEEMQRRNLDFLNTDRLAMLHPDAMLKTHVFANYVLTTTMKILYGTPFSDSQSGMWVFKRSIWPYLDVKSPGMPFSQEIKIEAHTKGFKCGEIPIEYRHRIGGAKISYKDAYHVVGHLLSKRLSIRRNWETLTDQ
jgi:glycosyltransferase involved in cell wall biosynthesis